MNHRLEFRRVTDPAEILDVRECVVRGESAAVPGSYLVGPADGWRVNYFEVNEDIDIGDEGDVLVTVYMEEIERTGFVMGTVAHGGHIVKGAE